MKKRPKQHTPPAGQPRPKQAVPVDIVTDLQTAIRNQFYADARDRWMKDQHFIKREFTLYLATWLDKRGVTLRPDRYKTLLLDLLNDIKTHGNTSAIQYFPGYLKHVLQQHLKHHGEDLYHEAKSLRTLAENTLLSLTGGTSSASPTSAPTLDPVRVMAEARRDLLQLHKARRTKHPSKSTQNQLDLL
jgi:hypothetical protein